MKNSFINLDAAIFLTSIANQNGISGFIMKYSLFVTLMMFTSSAFSQAEADSMRIVGLKNQSTTTSGTKKVDLLNEIAWEYGWAPLKDKSPTFSYASEAKDLAKQLNYQRGIGYALITLSWYKINENCDSLINAAIAIGEKEKDYRLVARAYHRRWEMKTALSTIKKQEIYKAKERQQPGFVTSMQARANTMMDLATVKELLNLPVFIKHLHKPTAHLFLLLHL
jgi:hypothetical protein